MASTELTLLAQAEKDLIELRRYSRREFGTATADRYVEDIRRVFGLLRDNPRAGALRPDLGADIRSFSKRRHRILYCVVEDGIQIVRVLHHSQDAERALDR